MSDGVSPSPARPLLNPPLVDDIGDEAQWRIQNFQRGAGGWTKDSVSAETNWAA